jgi:hypothetical protein
MDSGFATIRVGYCRLGSLPADLSKPEIGGDPE